SEFQSVLTFEKTSAVYVQRSQRLRPKRPVKQPAFIELLEHAEAFADRRLRAQEIVDVGDDGAVVAVVRMPEEAGVDARRIDAVDAVHHQHVRRGFAGAGVVALDLAREL